MAIEYTLDLAATATPTQVAEALMSSAPKGQLFDPGVTIDRVLSGVVTTVRGLWIGVGQQHSLETEILTSGFRFTPTLWTHFRFEKFKDFPDQTDDMITLTSAVLTRIPGDAVLHCQGDTIWLVRHDGEIFVNESEELWPSSRLVLLSRPYRRQNYMWDDENGGRA
ncbi:SitI3 family protein [Nocardia sp. NPDC052278]|uniref:SitI3 family protein n=1 Tax=unclassified Nocardia TaxID=2637762 RepID=UPI00368D35F4